jgi:hypothetical protein
MLRMVCMPHAHDSRVMLVLYVQNPLRCTYLPRQSYLRHVVTMLALLGINCCTPHVSHGSSLMNSVATHLMEAFALCKVAAADGLGFFVTEAAGAELAAIVGHGFVIRQASPQRRHVNIAVFYPLHRSMAEQNPVLRPHRPTSLPE